VSLSGQCVVVLGPRVPALCAAIVVICGCGDGSTRPDGPAQQWGAPSPVCTQWGTLDSALAAEPADARAEIAALVELLPEEYKQDAELRYFPGAGGGVKAEEAGARLDSFRLEECGPPP
jgi:hypothetical protein